MQILSPRVFTPAEHLPNECFETIEWYLPLGVVRQGCFDDFLRSKQPYVQTARKEAMEQLEIGRVDRVLIDCKIIPVVIYQILTPCPGFRVICRPPKIDAARVVAKMFFDPFDSIFDIFVIAEYAKAW